MNPTIEALTERCVRDLMGEASTRLSSACEAIECSSPKEAFETMLEELEQASILVEAARSKVMRKIANLG